MKASQNRILPFRSDLQGTALAGGLQILVVLACLIHTVAADQFGDFTYSDAGTAITIVDFNDFATGPVVIPETIIGKPVTAIAAWAFGGCNGITTISIPASVASIGTGAFGYCTQLTSLSVVESNPNFRSESGVLFDKVRSTLIRFPSAKGGAYAIPGTITRIETGAFRFCASLASVTIPAGVTEIRSEAFMSCGLLAEVSIPSSVLSTGDNAFYGCSKVSVLTIQEGVVSIGSYAFYGCQSLMGLVIPDSVRSIGSSAFGSCSGLKSLTISSNMTTISSSTFYGCSGLTAVTIPDGVTSLGDNAFKNCSGLAAISLPPSLTSIGKTAFGGCKKLTTVHIPSAVVGIGENAFSGCSMLASITVAAANQSYSDLDGVLFNKSKTGLIRYPATRSGGYTIPSSVTVIDGYAFSSCPGLTDVTVPTGITRIEKYAFSNCAGLAMIAFPEGLLSIENEAFSGCATLKNVTIASTVTALGDYAFAFCPSLESVTILSGAPLIGWLAFRDCVKLQRLVFAGNAPIVNTGFAKSPLPDLKIYYFNGKTGFTSPTSFGYPSVNMGGVTPLKTWLVSQSQPFDSDIMGDANGDGVNLLMAYALNLDPSKNLCSSLPVPMLSSGQMSLHFYSGRVGISYAAESSSDMIHWIRGGVIISNPDANQMRTATMNQSSPAMFMRLVVSQL